MPLKVFHNISTSLTQNMTDSIPMPAFQSNREAIEKGNNDSGQIPHGWKKLLHTDIQACM